MFINRSLSMQINMNGIFLYTFAVRKQCWQSAAIAYCSPVLPSVSV